MSEWITDRMPTFKDGIYVYDQYGQIAICSRISSGQPWKPIPKCEAYVKPKRYEVLASNSGWAVFDTTTDYYCADCISTREAAERIAAIYEEVML